MRRHFLAAGAVALGRGILASHASGATINAPLELGDVFTVNNNLNAYSQIRAGARVGGTVGYGAGTGNGRLGGIFTDRNGSLYFAGQPDGTATTSQTVERITLGQSASTTLLSSADFSGASGGDIRELAVAPSGNIYTLYTNGFVDKFTPSGGAYTRSPVGQFAGFTSADLGSGHQLSFTPDEAYLITSSRSQNRVWSMATATGTNQQWNRPVPAVIGPVTNAQIVPSAESALDPVRQNRVIVPMGNDGIYEIDFDPATGAFGADPRRLTNDAVAAFVDGLTFDPAGNLIVSLRDTASVGSLRELTQAELAAASAGTPFAIFDRPAFYTGGDARIARDVAEVVPEPSTGAVLGLAALGLLARRRSARP